jgi:hypothetical protein
MEFRVIWEIEIEADSPKEAALEARVVQLTRQHAIDFFAARSFH